MASLGSPNAETITFTDTEVGMLEVLNQMLLPLQTKYQLNLIVVK